MPTGPDMKMYANSLKESGKAHVKSIFDRYAKHMESYENNGAIDDASDAMGKLAVHYLDGVLLGLEDYFPVDAYLNDVLKAVVAAKNGFSESKESKKEDDMKKSLKESCKKVLKALKEAEESEDTILVEHEDVGNITWVYTKDGDAICSEDSPFSEVKDAYDEDNLVAVTSLDDPAVEGGPVQCLYDALVEDGSLDEDADFDEFADKYKEDGYKFKNDDHDVHLELMTIEDLEKSGYFDADDYDDDDDDGDEDFDDDDFGEEDDE